MEDPQPLGAVIETIGDTTYMRLNGDAVVAYSLSDPMRSLIEKAAKVPVAPFHYLRHDRASWLPEAGLAWGRSANDSDTRLRP